MENNLTESVKNAYEMCDYIDDNKIIKGNDFPLRFSLQQEFLSFLLFLSYINDDYSSEEQKFILDTLNLNIPKERALTLRTQRALNENGFALKVPFVLKCFVLSDAGKKISNDKYKYKKSRALVETYRNIGQSYIALNSTNTDEEIRLLTKYIGLMENFLKTYGLLHPDHKTQPVVLEEEEELSTEELLTELNSLTGLKSVKQEVNQLINLIKVQKLREEKGMKTTSTNKHLIFSGNPGSGKTTVARLLAKVYKSIGACTKGHLVEVDRSGLVSGYIGQTALKVQDVVESALGGILFIDEAYTLTNYKGEGDFGQEAVDTLLKCMEDHRDDLIVICAGYTELMVEFVNSNPGLKSRFSKVIEFEDYTAEEEIEILISMCKKQDYQLSADALKTAKAFFEDRIANKDDSFANARDVRNYLEMGIINQASRIVNDESFKGTDEAKREVLLKTIEGQDFENIKL